MALRRIFVDELDRRAAALSGEKAHHLHRVARLRRGELVELSDRRRVFVAEVVRSSRDRVEFAVQKEAPAPPPAPALTLQLAIFKFNRLEWVLEKAVELGVEAVVPVAAGRSDAPLVRAAARRVERWRKIAWAAAEQSRRLSPPEVLDPVSFSEAVRQPVAGRKLLLDPEGPRLRDRLGERSGSEGSGKAPGRVALLIGPEGGFTAAEREEAVACGYEPAGLGSQILRAETAALAALAVASHLLQADSRAESAGD